MGSLAAEALAALSLHEPIFQSIKYYVSGDVPDKITELLNSGGAERSQYFSDFVTHLLCGQNPNDTELTEATDLYEIPVVTPHWVIACVRLARLVSPTPYNPTRQLIFNNVVACIAKVTAEDAKRLYALITYHGGQLRTNLTSKCTHFICGTPSGKKYTAALSLPPGKLKIVTPDWVLESLRARIQAAADVFHPKLIVVPQPQASVRSESSRISAITGFDFEEGIAKNEVPTQNSAENKDDSTQALLDKLKQRMPWNHPPSAASASPQTSTSLPTHTLSTPGHLKNATQNTTPSMQKNIQGSSLMQHQYNQGVSNISQASNAHMNVLKQQMQQHQQSQAQQQQQGIQQSQQLLQQNQQMLQQNQVLQQNQQQAMQQNQQQSQQQNMQQNQQQNMQQNQQSIQQNLQQNQQNLQQNMQQNQQSMQQNQQTIQQSQQSQLHGLSAIQKQQQQLLQQRQFRMPILHQNQNKTLQQVFHQQNPNVSVGQMSQMQHLQSGQQYVQQSPSPNQTPTTTLSQAQQIQNITQMLSQSTANMQRAQLNQQASLKQGLLTNQQHSQQQQAVQSIAQHLAQSTQNLQQSQHLGQQQLLAGSVQTQQNQSGIMQQSVQPLGLNSQQQNMNSAGQTGIMVQSPQAQAVSGAGQPGTGQPAWRQQNIQMIQNAQGQHQIIRGPLVQTRNPQNQMILQQQLIQNQQGIMNTQQQSPQHTVQGNSHQIIQQNINSQGQTQHQILVQKQQLLNGGQQQIVHAPQQVLINQHSGQQQIVVHGNQHVTLQQGQQIVSQQMMGQGGQLLTAGGQHLVTQGSQHQVLIAQSSQQMVSQSGGPQIVQQQVLNSGGGPVHQIITHGGGQQLVSPGAQQLVQGQSISWQQQQYLQQRQQIAQPNTPRVSWAAGGGGRQLIHLDAQTHAQLQQMDPQQRALFVAQLQKRRQMSLQRSAIQQQQGGGGGAAGGASPAGTAQSVTFIRGKIPQGLTQQQQVQWLQQQGARAAALPVTPPAQPPQSPVSGGGGNANGGGAAESQLQQLQVQRQQHYQRLQQLQAQRDHVIAHHKTQGVGVGVQGVGVQGGAARAAGGAPGAVLAEPAPDGTLLAAAQDHQQGGGGLVVNPKTKTALANMLSIRLQSTGTPAPSPTAEHEPSAAGTLRLMTAAHVAAASGVAGVRQPPTRLVLHPAPLHAAHAPHAGHAAPPGKVYGAAPAVRAVPPRSQFYGHNPNLKLPPDLFLLGCVFHIVEYQQSWGAERVARWAEVIGRRGGEVETSYCSRVTHVLCETQKHGVVMQALRDAKRCVTAFWLSDAMLRRAVAPPWQALHLPTLYTARDRPARHHRAAVSGWRGDEHERVTHMLELIGAKLTPYMSKDNTVLVCKRAEGVKYRRAREWGIPVVSSLWLTDLLLANTSALSQIENTKYQQFNVGSPFRMDYALVSHLMNAWKMPINITQESHERAKRTLPTPPRRAKRPRLDHAPDAAVSIPSAASPAPQTLLPLAPRILFSAIGPKQFNKLSLIVRQLGGVIVTQAAEATHLVMEKLVRTSKLVAGLVTVKHLLTPAWLIESQRVGKFADEAEFPLRDPAFDTTHKCDISEVLLCGEQRRKLLDGVTFFLTPRVQPSRAVLTEIIELCGGTVDKSRKSYVWIAERHRNRPHSYLVLAAHGDLHLVYYLLQPDRALSVVCSAEVVFAAVLRQKLQVDEFVVKAD